MPDEAATVDGQDDEASGPLAPIRLFHLQGGVSPAPISRTTGSMEATPALRMASSN